MRFCPAFPVLLFAALPLLAGAQDGAVLDYRLKVRMYEDSVPEEGGFRLVASPALVTGNREQRPRMGAWRIEPEAGAAPAPAMLVRALGLCYFSGPAAQVVPLAQEIRIGGRRCRLWQVQTPPGMGAYAYLAEVAPNLLALAYLSATLPGGDPRSVEIHLAGLRLGPRACPAEEGTALLKTLQHWAARVPDPGPGQSEEVP